MADTFPKAINSYSCSTPRAADVFDSASHAALLGACVFSYLATACDIVEFLVGDVICSFVILWLLTHAPTISAVAASVYRENTVSM